MSSSPVTLSGGISDVEVARLQWLESTSPEERKAIATALRGHDTTTIQGINALAADLFILVLAGELSPSVALAAKPFLDFLTANTWQLMAQSGHGQAAPTVIAETIVQLRERLTMKANYTTAPKLPAPAVDVLEAEAGEKVEVG